MFVLFYFYSLFFIFQEKLKKNKNMLKQRAGNFGGWEKPGLPPPPTGRNFLIGKLKK